MSTHKALPISTAAREEGKSIILLKISTDGTIEDIDIGCWDPGRDDPGCYDPPFSDWTSNRGIEEPTHWMPLPEIVDA